MAPENVPAARVIPSGEKAKLQGSSESDSARSVANFLVALETSTSLMVAPAVKATVRPSGEKATEKTSREFSRDGKVHSCPVERSHSLNSPRSPPAATVLPEGE